MIRVEIIGSENALVFQDAMNRFIKDKKVVDIKYQPILLPKVYEGNVPVRSAVLDRALIVYVEGEDDETI